MDNILKCNRDALPELLKENCKYDYLKSLLVNCDITNLFLGNIGFECNKQRAIYELPTEELLTILKCICDCLEIKNIEEMAAGQGLLAHMMQHYFGASYNVTATDGLRWIETSSNKRYYHVENKLFLQYCTENSNVNYDDKLLVISWLPEDDIDDFVKILKKKNPKNVVIIGCPFYNHIFHILKPNLEQLNYKAINIPIKQIGLYQYFQSSTIFLTRSPSETINNVLLNIKLKYPQHLLPKMTKLSDKNIIREIIKGHTFLNETMDKMEMFYNDNDNQEKFKKLTKYCTAIVRNNLTIPDYLKKYSEFCFWIRKATQYKFPTKITTRDKFKEYRQLLHILGEEDGLNKLKEKGIICNWINDTTDAEKFIWLDYSHSSKKWKESSNSFTRLFNQVYSMHSNQNTFVNFVALPNFN